MTEAGEREKARGLIANLVDQITDAVRADDDAAVTILDRQLRYAERTIERAELLARQHAQAERVRLLFRAPVVRYRASLALVARC